MYYLVIIIISTFSIEREQAAAYDSCGTLTSNPVQEGHNITLVYVPDKKYFNHSRKWYQYDGNQYTLLYDSAADITSKSSKYFEVSSSNDYRMIIRDPSIKDAGVYVIICLNEVVYSDAYRLHMSRGDLTTVPAFDKHTTTDTTAETRVTQTIAESEHNSSSESCKTHNTRENMFLIGIGIGVLLGFVVTTGFVTVILAICKRLKMSKSRKTLSAIDNATPEGKNTAVSTLPNSAHGLEPFRDLKAILPKKSQTESLPRYLSLRHTSEIDTHNFLTEYSQPEMTSRPNWENDENAYEIPV